MVKKAVVVPLPDEIVLEIGRITVAWGLLEYILKLTIKRLLNLPTFSEGMFHAEKTGRVEDLLKEIRKLLDEHELNPVGRAMIDKVLGPSRRSATSVMTWFTLRGTSAMTALPS
jgi:hypothetical protein